MVSPGGSHASPNLISFYDERTGLVDEERAVDIVYLEFMKVFNTVSHPVILTDKLLRHGLEVHRKLAEQLGPEDNYE